MSVKALKFGVLLPSSDARAWVEHLISEVVSTSVAQIAFVGVTESSALHRSLRRPLWALYTALDRCYARYQPNAFERRDLRSVASELHHFGRTQIPLISGLDVVLLIGDIADRRDLLPVPRFGLWWFDDGGGAAAAAETVANTQTTATTLWARLPDGSERPIYRSWSRTNNKSVWRNRQRYYWKAAHVPARILRQLGREGVEALGVGVEQAGRSDTAVRVRTPGNVRAVIFALQVVGRALSDLLKTIFFQRQWCLAYEYEPSNSVEVSPGKLHLMIPPRDRFWADPFPIYHNDRWYVVVEEWLYRTGKGHISALEFSNGEVRQVDTILEANHHLSYPFVFSWRDDLYMIPEEADAQLVVLYRCRTFPKDWERDCILLKGVNGVDATIEEVDGTWWMFVNIGKKGISNHDELHLYFADNPRGPWEEHPQNPVKSDVRSARPAGRLIRVNGELLRPSQDCSLRYGSAICLHRIVELTRESFVEVPVQRFDASSVPGADRIHTLNRVGPYQFVDFHRQFIRNPLRS